MATRSAAGRSRKTSPPIAGADSTRARLRLGTVVLLALLAAWCAVLGVRLLFVPPAGIAAAFASVIGLLYVANALVYGLGARWVAVQKRWGHIVALVVVALNLVLGLSDQMSWLEWTVVAVNLVALGLLIATLPRRR